MTHPRRPGDFSQRAKFVLELATGQITQEEAQPPDERRRQ